MLATLFPDRVDIGIGRAPGGSADATNALSENFLQQVWNMPNAVKDLLHFLNQDFPAEHEFSKVSASPIPPTSPVPWLLGTSKKSALLAAENGMAYTFGLFMSENDGAAIIQQYLDRFQPRKPGQLPKVIVTVSVICAETDEKAEEFALSSLFWGLQRAKGEGEAVPSIDEAKRYKPNENEIKMLEKMKQKMIIGNPQKVKQKLNELQTTYQTDEIMIVSITHAPEDRIQSYQLIAKEAIPLS